MAKKYTLRRNSDGSLYETTSATTANDMVANGVAKLVKEPASNPAPEAKRRPVVEPKADESK